MNMVKRSGVPVNLLLFVALCAMLAGCASTPKVDWGSRVGSYTFEQAKEDMGEPTKVLRFQDGTMLAEWITGQTPITASPTTSASSGGGAYGPRRQPFDRDAMDTLARGSTMADYLHLTFSKEGRLMHWEKGRK